MAMPRTATRDPESLIANRGDPYLQGYQNYFQPDGSPMKNPYASTSQQYKLWSDGYEEARGEHETDS